VTWAVYTYGRDITLMVYSIDKSLQQARFPDPGVTNEDELERMVVPKTQSAGSRGRDSCHIARSSSYGSTGEMAPCKDTVSKPQRLGFEGGECPLLGIH